MNKPLRTYSIKATFEFKATNKDQARKCFWSLVNDAYTDHTLSHAEIEEIAECFDIDDNFIPSSDTSTWNGYNNYPGHPL